MIGFFLRSLIKIQLALAAEDINVTGGIGELPNPLRTRSIGELLQRIWTALFYLSIPLVAIMIIIGAFQIMFAAGNEEKIKTGRRTVIYAAVGFAIIISVQGIIAVIKELLGVNCPTGTPC